MMRNQQRLLIIGMGLIAPCIFLALDKPHHEMIFQSSFEDSSYSKYLHEEKCCQKSIQISTDFARQGKKSIRFELGADDPLIYKGKRSELVGPKESSAKFSKWYSVSVLPFYKIEAKDSTFDIVLQWHEVHDAQLGEEPRSPPISLQIKDQRWQLVVMWATEQVNTNKSVSGKKVFDLGPFHGFSWVDWTFRINFSYEEDGVIEIWKNKKKVLGFQGPNYYNDIKGPFLKFGIYKPEWNKFNSTNVPSKVLYFDCIKIASTDATLKQLFINKDEF